ncbi:hypothetical protein XTPLMG728_2807 [Xanthomonas translucens pv. poae]|uniref:Uncharacterized protein n=1 Tax=Xanthomonas graminis pv. poae TaxID=227946 RepID=A0A0K2ZZN5_9XANT|nr:hypothetical protein XTPLMG728_2807 [Xanthomonas translucens pv. poae]
MTDHSRSNIRDRLGIGEQGHTDFRQGVRELG